MSDGDLQDGERRSTMYSLLALIMHDIKALSHGAEIRNAPLSHRELY